MIRKANIRRLGRSAHELSLLGIGGYSYWAAILAEGSTKAYGEKAARKLEDALKIQRGSLDIPDADLSKPTSWPFEGVEFSRWVRLSERQKGQVEKAVNDELDRIEGQQSQANGTTGT